ncbi:MAG TPA: polyprenyl synthetase family protein [Sphaerochaeta sp.]|nr:polyprenyl synthetase family protein [Sphaerochaeta sp.]
MQDFWHQEPLLKEQLADVHALILATVSEASPFIRPLLLDYLAKPGKMLRPALTLITSTLGDTEVTEQVIEAAAIVELIHLASLVHDDIIDEAPKRRGVPTLYARVGAKQAVLAGDYLLAKALALVSAVEALDPLLISRSLSRLLESELEQDASVGQWHISEQTYLRRIGGKTASLFGLAAYTGAVVSEQDRAIANRVHRIGYRLGIAFQIQDDLLDYTGNSDCLGKATAVDLRSGIPTLPLIYALQEEQLRGTDTLATLLASKRLTKGKLQRAVALVTELGGIERTKAVEAHYRSAALVDIATLKNPAVEGQLRGLLARLSHRSV